MRLWKRKNGFKVGWGIPLREVLKKEAHRLDVYIPDEIRSGHIGVFGTTRTGKTRLAENLAEHDIRTGKSVWIFDPKGDIDLLAKVIQVAWETGRLKEFIFFSPIHLNISEKLNPLAYWVMLEEVTHHIASGVSGAATSGDAAFFYKVAKEVLLVVARSLQVLDVAAGRQPEFNIVRLNNFISYTDIQRLLVQLENVKRTVNAEIDGRTIKEIVEQELLPKITQMLASGEEHFSKVSGTLRAELSQFAIGSISQLFGAVKRNVVFEKLHKKEPIIFYCMTGSLLTRDTAHIIARILLSGLQAVAWQKNAKGETFSPPLSIIIDEASNVVYYGMEDLYNKIGGTRGYLTSLTQSIADYSTVLGENFTQKIMDNLNIQIFLRVNHMATSKYVSDKAGKIRVFSPIISMGGFSSARETEKKLLPDDAATKLEPREYIAFVYEKSYIGKTATVSPSRLKLKMPELPLSEPTPGKIPTDYRDLVGTFEKEMRR